jgi:hypothetical protein
MNGADSHGACKRAGLDSGAAHVSADNLIRERNADPIEIDTPSNCTNIAALNSAYQYEQIVDRPGDIADPS